MAKIEQRPGGWSQRVSLTNPVTGQRTVARVTARTKRELAAAVAARRVQFERECASPADRVTTMTVTEAVEAWIRDRDISDASRMIYEGILRTHVAGDPFGAMPVSHVEVRHVEDWIARKRETHAARTVQKNVSIVRAAFARLVRRRELTYNPAADVGNVPTVPKRQRVKALSSEQANTLLDAARGSRYEPVVVIGLMMGLRIGEMLALRWTDVDLNAGLLRVERTLTREKRGERYVWIVGDRPKTESSARSLLMPLRVQACLRHQLTEQTERLGTAGEFVVDRGDGTRYQSPANVQVGFRKLCDDCGLPGWVTVHSLRHSYATAMLRAGVPLATVARMMGHSSPNITLAEYGWVVQGMEDEAAALAETLYANEPAPVVRDVRLAREG